MSEKTYIPAWAYPTAWNQRQRRLRACDKERKAFVRKCANWKKEERDANHA